MEQKDRVRLEHVLEEARRAVEFVRDKKRSDLDEDTQLTLSLLKTLEMIGHSASLVTRDCRQGCRPIPWEIILELKHQVVHTYLEIDRDWIWATVHDDLPPLIDALEVILGPDSA